MKSRHKAGAGDNEWFPPFLPASLVCVCVPVVLYAISRASNASLKMLEDATKPVVTLLGEEWQEEMGPQSQNRFLGLRAAICTYKPVFAYASIQLCIQALAMLKQI